MKSHGKSKAVLTAVIFEVNLLQSSRFGESKRLKLLILAIVIASTDLMLGIVRIDE